LENLLIDVIAKLERAKLLLENQVKDLLLGINLEAQYPRLVASFRDGIVLYVRFNKYDQYSYSILIAESELDRCRFDNFDDKWLVPSKPHHFHPRMNNQAFKSPMNGNLDDDFPALCNLLRTGCLFSKNHRF
jgi:hypothetical protein